MNSGKVRLYDLWNPLPSKIEYTFFKQLIPQSGTALELGCGTGRLLLPLLKDGYAIEGIDHAAEMLALCTQKAVVQNLEPTLYQQRIQEMQLPKKYDLIFSALDTFGHIANHDDAFKALCTIYGHLNLHGTFAVYLNLPWLYAPENASEWRQINQATIDGEQYTLHEKSVHDPLEQLFYHYYRVKKDRAIIDEYETVVRWYSRYEFTDMLTSVGFKNICVRSGYTGEGSRDEMVFIAQRI